MDRPSSTMGRTASEPRPRVHPRSDLTEEQAETLYRLLVDARRAVQERLERLRQARFTPEPVAESEEAAALDTEQATSIDLAESERMLLLQIDHALRKMQSGTYGVSEASHEPIGFDRLRIVPWATLGASEQERVEHQVRQRGR
jgi:DnaK suppressor protein